MKIILLADVYKHGVAGEVVEVADGFARNYLIPKRLAAKASAGELKKAAKLQETADARRAALDNRLNDLARQIDGVELIFGRKAAVTGKLFGSITTTDVAEALNDKTGIDINRRRISQQSIRELGSFDVPVRLGNEISPTLKIIVVREDEMADFLSKRAAAAEAAEAAETVVEETVPDVVEAVVEAEAGEETAG